jgi:hypothetical protein
MKQRSLPFLALLTLFAASPVLQAQALRGNDLQIHQALAPEQPVSDVGVADDGRFVVVWTRLEGGTERAYFRLFGANGRPRLAPVRLASSGSQRTPRVTMAPNGSFVIVWEAGNRVFGRRFDAAGRPLGNRFPLSLGVGTESLPEVALARDGRFLVAWSEQVPPVLPTDSPNVQLFARWYAADGSPGTAFLVANDFLRATHARIAINANGGVALVFQGFGGENVFHDIYLQRYKPDGTPRAPRVQVNTDEDTVGADQIEATVALADDGRCLVAWTDAAGDFLTDPTLPFEDIRGVRARLFRGDAGPLTESFAVNTFQTGEQHQPQLALRPDGSFLVAWTSSAGQDGSGAGIFLRTLGRGGEILGDEVRGNLGTRGQQFLPALALARTNFGVVAWTSQPRSSPGQGVFARRLTPN